MTRRPFWLAASLVLSACAMRAQPSLPNVQAGIPLYAPNASGAGKITHVVYVVQENRSFDDLFHGYPGADTVSSGKDSYGRTIRLQPASLSDQYEVDHSAQAMFQACDGSPWMPGTECRMDGFNNEMFFAGPPNPAYVYVPHKESKPYFDMAHEWVLADRMFASQLDESYVAHQYAIAAQAAWSVDLPTRYWECGGGKDNTISTILKNRDAHGPNIKPCFDYETLGDELDHAKLSWRFYASQFGSGSSGGGSVWSSYRSIRHVRYGPDWKYVVSPNWKFITDVRAGRLANFTWITPVCADSDHSNMRRRLRTLVGFGAGQYGGREQVLELDRNLRAMGRLGRHVRSRSSPRMRIATAWASAFRFSSYPPTRNKTTSRTCSTKPPVCFALPRMSSDWAGSRAPTGARTRPQAIASIFRRSLALS